MTAVKEQTIRRRLEALKARLRPEVTAMTEQALSPSGGQGANELSNVPLHLGDGGTDEYLHDLNATLLENEEYLANEVQAALHRLEEGAYGSCERCRRPIAQARLDAIPYTRYCIKCAEVAGSAPDINLDKGRPHSPDDTLAPEGEMGEYRGRDAENPFTDLETKIDRSRSRSDVHASGTPGGGGSAGGLAGTNDGHGDPNFAELEDAMGSGNYDVANARDNDRDVPKSGHSGGAVGGTPANKRAR